MSAETTADDKPQRLLGPFGAVALIVGIVIGAGIFKTPALVAAIYLLVNMTLLHGLGLRGLSESTTAASDVLGLASGPWTEKELGLFVAIAALTSINATMMVGARVNYAVGLDCANWVNGKARRAARRGLMCCKPRSVLA